MGGRGGSMGGSHGMGGGGAAAKTAPQAAPQTREQQLLARIKGDPAALMQMSDADAADAVAAIDKLPIATDGTQHDIFAQRYMALLGWDTRKPEVLSDTDYEKARKKAGEESMYHADEATNAAAGKAYNDQFLSGSTAYYSGGVHGAGTYWAHDDAAGSAGYGAYQLKAFLNSKAKPVTTYQLRQEYAKLRRQKPKLFAALRSAKGDYGVDAENMYPLLAAAKGYNTIINNSSGHNTGRKKGQYVVTLDRSVLTVSRKTVKNASAGMLNW